MSLLLLLVGLCWQGPTKAYKQATIDNIPDENSPTSGQSLVSYCIGKKGKKRFLHRQKILVSYCIGKDSGILWSAF
jgi:hypothetical protein